MQRSPEKIMIFERFKNAFLKYARHVRSNWVFTGDDNDDANVGGPGVAMTASGEQHGKRCRLRSHKDMASVVCESDRRS